MGRFTRKKQTSWNSAAARRLRELAGSPATINDAVRIISQRLLHCISCPPTDLHALAERLGIIAIEEADLPFTGELREESGRFRIVYAKYMSEGRQRFTIAHEMSHAIIAQTGPRWPRAGAELERICDMLATELLMPIEVFRRLSSNACSLNAIRGLAHQFRVSLLAAALRCTEVYGISVFEVNGSRVTLGRGLIRGNRKVADLDSEVARAVEEVLQGKQISRRVEVTYRQQSFPVTIEGMRTGRDSRAIFVLRSPSPQFSPT